MADVLSREALLGVFLRVLAVTPFEFGQWDCGITIANWSVAAGGGDPGAGIRGAYSDEAGWRALALAHGGLPRWIDRQCAKAGLSPVAVPLGLEVGDIGAVVIDRLNMTAGGIFLGRTGNAAGGAGSLLWSVKIAAGVTQVRAAPLSAWRP